MKSKAGVIFLAGTSSEDITQILKTENVENKDQKWKRNFIGVVLMSSQEGYIEELSTCFYLDTTVLNSSESILKGVPQMLSQQLKWPFWQYFQGVQFGIWHFLEVSSIYFKWKLLLLDFKKE